MHRTLCVERFTGILPKISAILSLPRTLGAEYGAGGDCVRLWLTLMQGRLTAYIGKKEGNVFIENGIWIIIVVLAMILPIEALRNALITAFGRITQDLSGIQ